MADDLIVILLIWLFYVVECIIWSKKDVYYFQSLFWHKWKIVRPSETVASATAGLVFRFPFPPLGVIAPTNLPRLAFSPEGLSIYVSEDDAMPGQFRIHSCSYEEIETIDTKDRDILINNRQFVKAESKACAMELGEFVRRLKNSKAKDREKIITNQITDMFKQPEILAKIDDLKEQTSVLFSFCNILWIYLILAIPILLFVYGFSRPVLPFLGAVLLTHFVITGITFRTYLKIYKRRKYALFYILLPSPFYSVRAMDVLSKELLMKYHPFAVASALLPHEGFLAYARKSFARIRHPIYDLSVPEKAIRIDQWYKNRLILIMGKAIRSLGIDMDSFLLPAEESEEGPYLSYCPRCLCLYLKECGSCTDCNNINLVPMPRSHH